MTMITFDGTQYPIVTPNKMQELDISSWLRNRERAKILTAYAMKAIPREVYNALLARYLEDAAGGRWDYGSPTFVEMMLTDDDLQAKYLAATLGIEDDEALEVAKHGVPHRSSDS